MGFVSDFKKFAMRGNVMDMAVGIIIGAAFSAVVTSIVSDVIMPPIGLLLGGVDFADLGITLKEASGDKAAVVLSYGKFINTIISFLIIALSVFMLIKAINKLDKIMDDDEPAVVETPATPTKEEELLSEIRDLLKQNGELLQKKM